MIRHAAIIPYAYHKENLWFLLGKEHDSYTYNSKTGKYDLWKGSRQWSFFGGGPEEYDPSYVATAIREAYEESMGFLGNIEEIASKVDPSLQINTKNAVFYPVQYKFNGSWPDIFSRVVEYFSKCARTEPVSSKVYENTIRTCPKGYLEKVEIEWMTYEDILNNKDLFSDIFLSFAKKHLGDSFYFPDIL